MREVPPAEAGLARAGAVPVATPVAVSARPRSRRDPRLDVLRGAALVTIFITHVPGNAYEAWTLREWGFSDAAEGFVLMAGVSAGIAYGPALRPGAAWGWAEWSRPWGRAWTLYLVHLLITAAAFGIAAGLALWAEAPGLLQKNGIDQIVLSPLRTLAGLPLLMHQIGYANILPLYAALLLVAPAAIWAGWRRPGWVLAGSVALWAAAGTLRWNMPTMPLPVGWHFSPFSWQLLFVIGLLTGLAMRQGRRLVPVRRGLVAGAAGFLLLALAWRLIPAVGDFCNWVMWRLQEGGAPWILTSHQKTWETAPRLLHALALAYLLSALPAVRRACESPAAGPLALLGRHSLPVFALGSVLAFLFQGIKTETGQDLRLDSAMLLGGLLLMLALARARDGRHRA